MTSPHSVTWILTALTLYLIQTPLTDSGFDRCTERRLGPAATELCYKNILYIRAKVSCRHHKLWLNNGINVGKTSDIEYAIVGDCIRLGGNPRPKDCLIERDDAFQEEIVQCFLIESRDDLSTPTRTPSADGRPTDSPKTSPPNRRTDHFTTFWLSTVQYSGLSLGLLGCSFALYCSCWSLATDLQNIMNTRGLL